MYRKDTPYSIQIKIKNTKEALKNITQTYTYSHMYMWSILEIRILEPMLSYNKPEKLILQLYQIHLAGKQCQNLVI